MTITVDLNDLQNASKCTISKEKIQQFFWGGGEPPSQTPPPSAPPFLEPPPNHISGYGPAAVSNIRPTGHNPTRQVFLSSLRGLPEMSKMIDLCVSGVNFQALKYAETRFMHPLPIPFPPGCPRHLDLAPD